MPLQASNQSYKSCVYLHDISEVRAFAQGIQNQRSLFPYLAIKAVQTSSCNQDGKMI
jgi:hypothetical protein